MSWYNNYELIKQELEILKNIKVKNFSYVWLLNKYDSWNKNEKIINFLKDAKYIKKILYSEPWNIVLYEKNNQKIIIR